MMAHKSLCSCAVGLITLLLSSVSSGREPLDALPTEKPVTELSRKTVDLGTHKVTFIRITPPRLPVLPTPPVIAVAPPSAKQLAEDEARAAKTYEQLSATVTVYPGAGERPTVSDLTWWHEGKRYQAWSNIDFRLLTQIPELETETHVFSWFPFVSEGSVEEIPVAERPTGLSLFTLADTTPQYYLEGSVEEIAPIEGTLHGLDYLHAYYQLHHARLTSEYAERLAVAAAQEAELAKNLPRPMDTVIHFWKASAAANP
jgi:hypothetical protein